MICTLKGIFLRRKSSAAKAVCIKTVIFYSENDGTDVGDYDILFVSDEVRYAVSDFEYCDVISGGGRMDWTERMNLVMDYVEQHLHDKISESAIAEIAACPYSLFAASFSQITGVSFSEYVRRRKLTCAAYDLQNTNETIMELALKYGYQSADAFRVAFKNLHHVSPAAVRKNNVKLTFYCRLYFEITMKGVEKMEYTIADKDSFKVLGIRRITPYGGGTWAIVKSDGSNDRIKEISGKFFDLGLCFGFQEDGSAYSA